MAERVTTMTQRWRRQGPGVPPESIHECARCGAEFFIFTAVALASWGICPSCFINTPCERDRSAS